MKLEEATSKEQVAQGIADGDEELRDSVDTYLEEVRNSFMSSNAHYGEEEEEPSEVEYLYENVKFVDKVISESRSTGFDLSRVPRDSVVRELQTELSSSKPVHERRTSFAGYGPFAISSGGRDSPSLEWSYPLPRNRSYYFSDDHFDVDGLRLNHLIPDDLVKSFWKDIATDIDSSNQIEWSESELDQNTGYGPDEPHYFGPYSEEKWTEFCRDIIRQHINTLVESDPASAYALFLNSARSETGTDTPSSELLAKAKKAAEDNGDDFPTEDILDYVIKYFEADDSDDREAIVAELDRKLITTFEPEKIVTLYLEAAEDFLDRRDASVEGIMRKVERGQTELQIWEELLAAGFHNRDEVREAAEGWFENWEGRSIPDPSYNGRDIVNVIERYIFSKDPEAAVDAFIDQVTAVIQTNVQLGQEGADVVRKALRDGKSFSKEDVNKMAFDWGRGFNKGSIKETLEDFAYANTAAGETVVAKFIEDIVKILSSKDSAGPEGAAIVRKAIEEKHFSKKNIFKMALRWRRGKDSHAIKEELEDYALAILDGGDGVKEANVLETITVDELKKLGITSGPLFEEAPLTLVNLPAKDLAEEGRRMRHCVGDAPNYAREVRNKTKEIWSLRTRNNKPIFTLDIDTNLHKNKKLPADDTPELSAKKEHKRAEFVKQLKGKANRTPGLDRAYDEKVTKPDEVVLWKYLLKKLHIAPDQVHDFTACKLPMPSGASQVQASLSQQVSLSLSFIADRLSSFAPRQLVAALDEAAELLAE